MRHIALYIPIIISASLLLSGCDNSQKANKENFEKAINQKLEAKCITLRVRNSFPVEEEELKPNYLSQKQVDESNDRTFKPLNALVKAGILKSEKSEFTKFGQKVSGYKYDLTDNGKKYLLPGSPGLFCIGKYKVADILNFTPPAEVHGRTISKVNFTYSPSEIPDWVKSEEVKNAIPSIANKLKEKQSDSITLFLYNDGWSAKP